MFFLTLFTLTIFSIATLFYFIIDRYIQVPKKITLPELPIPDEYVSAAAGLLGVILGVVLTEYNRIYSEKRKLKRELIDKLSILIKDFKLLLLKTKKAANESATDNNLSFEIEATELLNKLNLINIKLWDTFNEIKIKASVNRLIQSVKMVLDEAKSNNQSYNKDVIEIGGPWVADQHHELIELMLKSANVKNKVKQLPLFIKAKNLNPLYMEKSDFEVHAPPWQPYIGFYLVVEPDEKIKEQIRSANYERIKNKRCPEHKYAAHLFICGYSVHNSEIYTRACCETFRKQIFNITNSSKGN